jgi:hypothetical protein
MNRSPWSGLIASIIVFSVFPWSAANNLDRMDEPWPVLLSDEPAPADPAVAALQRRAEASLEKLVQSARSVD